MYKKRNNVQFIGLKDLHPDDQEKIKDIIYTKSLFIEREIKKINSLRLHFKTYKQGGNKRYSVHLMINSPGKVITADRVSESSRWDPIAAVYEVIDDAREQIRHKFKL